MPVILANNANGNLAASITAAATTFTLQSGQGERFPAPSVGDWFPVTLVKSTGEIEVCKCTARSGDIFTVVRAQEGTIARAFDPGSKVSLRITNAVFAEIFGITHDDAINALAALAPVANGLPFFTGPNSASQTPLTAFARSVLDDADAPTMRSTLDIKASTLAGDSVLIPAGTSALDYFVAHPDVMFRIADGTTTGMPTGFTGGPLLFQVQAVASGAATHGSLTAMHASTGDLWTNTLNAGVWTGWAKQYSTDNILGIVSQVSGVPTGAVIEAGNNANGSYVKFADGTMLCSRSYTDSSHTTTTNSGLNAKNMINITKPATFTGNSKDFAFPCLLGGETNGLRWCGNSGVGTGASVWNFVSISAVAFTGATLSWHLFAIGRWY